MPLLYDFAYISVIQCKFHKINYCIYHDILCKCQPDQIKLVYRYSTRSSTRWRSRSTTPANLSSR